MIEFQSKELFLERILCNAKGIHISLKFNLNRNEIVEFMENILPEVLGMNDVYRLQIN